MLPEQWEVEVTGGADGDIGTAVQCDSFRCALAQSVKRTLFEMLGGDYGRSRGDYINVVPHTVYIRPKDADELMEYDTTNGLHNWINTFDSDRNACEPITVVFWRQPNGTGKAYIKGEI